MFVSRARSRSLQQVFTLRLSSNIVKGILECKQARFSCRGLAKSGKEIPEQTMSDVKEKLYKLLGAHKGYFQPLVDRGALMKFLPEAQSELPTRNMNDSFDQATIPLKTDVNLQNKYTTPQGFVRRGRLMEDMDIFAVWIAFKHISNPKAPDGGMSPYNFVTAVVDQIAFSPILPEPDADICLSGHVSWVGTSSLEITVWLEQMVGTEWRRITRGIFLVAARNSINTGSAIVNKLVPTNEEETKIIQGGLARKEHRIKLQEKNLLKMVPDQSETQVLHKLFVDTVCKEDKTYETRSLPPGSNWLSDTVMTTFISSHPENRNMHNTVFGGFLMRQAMELSWNCCFMYCNIRPHCLYIGDIIFHRPVPVGSLIKMISRVVYTEGNIVQLSTYADVHDLVSGTAVTSNEFHFTYRSPVQVKPVYPKTYSEAMMYINGRRHFTQAISGLDPLALSG